MATPNPSTLWFQACEEAGDDAGKRTARYLELMRKHGHVMNRDEMDDTPLLPCGWDPRKDVPVKDVPVKGFATVAFEITDDSPRTNTQRLAHAIEATIRRGYPDLMVRRLEWGQDDSEGWR